MFLKAVLLVMPKMPVKDYINYLVSLPFKGSPLHLIKESSKDLIGIKSPVRDNTAHIKAAVEWLLEAQKANNDGGVAALYSLLEGWHSSYSETTGYTIPTMLNYYEKTKNRVIMESAVKMADWELSKQMPSGAFPGGAVGNNEYPIVFNTGQVIFGMVGIFQKTNQLKYKNAAVKAADWLVSVQNKNGCWDRFDYLNKIHVYNTRTAWSLLRAYEIAGKEAYLKSAAKNIEWALSQQLDNGWFMNSAFYESQEPMLHTIAYTIQGILEAGVFLKNQKYISSAKKAADALLNLQRKDGSLAGSFGKSWKSGVSWSCLTGDSQMAIVWLRLHQLAGDKNYLNAAKRINNYVKSVQNLNSKNPGVRGGIKGAHPIYGWYAPFCYINWAAKFFIDALMLEDDSTLAGKMS